MTLPVTVATFIHDVKAPVQVLIALSQVYFKQMEDKSVSIAFKNVLFFPTMLPVEDKNHFIASVCVQQTISGAGSSQVSKTPSGWARRCRVWSCSSVS